MTTQQPVSLGLTGCCHLGHNSSSAAFFRYIYTQQPVLSYNAPVEKTGSSFGHSRRSHRVFSYSEKSDNVRLT
jgi:hypothetical protein